MRRVSRHRLDYDILRNLSKIELTIYKLYSLLVNTRLNPSYYSNTWFLEIPQCKLYCTNVKLRHLGVHSPTFTYFIFVTCSLAFPHNVLQRGNNVVQHNSTWLQRSKKVTEREQTACTTLCCVLLRCGTLRYVVAAARQEEAERDTT